MNLQGLSLPELLQAWDDYDKRGADLAGVRALCLEDRFYLLVKALGRVDLLHPWLYARCREVEAEPDGYLDLWAREHYKSTIITFGGAIQELLRDPNLTIGIFSHTKPIAKAFLAQIKREFEQNEVLGKAFPDVMWANPHDEAPSWSLDAGLILRRTANPKEASIEAHGLVDGQPTSRHFGLLIYDDVVTKESVNTPEQIQKTTEAWELSDNLGKEGGRKWHIGTRYSYADTYQAIIERGAAIVRLHAATDNGKIDGKPVLFSQEVWTEKVKTQGEATVSCQMLQNPLAGKQRMFDVEDFREYEVRPEVLNCYLLIDPARSKKKDSAKTAMALVGLDHGGNKYLLDGYNHRMDLQERWQRMKELYQKWYRASGIQTLQIGYEIYGAQADFDYFRERVAVEKVSLPLIELAWPREGDGSKVDRVQRLVPDLKNHRIYLPYPTGEARKIKRADGSEEVLPANPNRLTALQQKMKDQGAWHRISKAIKRVDSDGKIYDLSDDLKLQAHYFPFGSFKDLIDAFARIYDMEASPPVIYETHELEPAHV